jgi:hypothetical protein
MLNYARRILLASVLFSVTAAFAQRQPKIVSLIQLIASPQKFDGNLISVHGYLVRVGEKHDTSATFLYLHKEDADNKLDNSILVGSSEHARNDLRELDRKYVTLTGTFRAVPAANDSYIAEITQVQSCTLWSDPDRPIGRK